MRLPAPSALLVRGHEDTVRPAIEAYCEAIFDTDRGRALQVVEEAIARGVTPEQVVFEIVVPSIDHVLGALGPQVGASLAQHFMAAQIAAEVTEAMVPRFQRGPEVIGRVVIGNSQGDFHGLGKRVVIGCLKAHLIDVVDLGLNVAPERFVDEAVAKRAQVIGISSMMVHTARSEHGARAVRRLLRERGLEGRIKIAVGGAPYRFDRELYRVVGADAWADNGLLAAQVIQGLIREVAP
jgi:methanogenic corrinoid protein MtbC1